MMLAHQAHESRKGGMGAQCSRTPGKSPPAEAPPPNLIWQQLATRVQTKLSVSAPDNPYEREADQVADRVMRMPEPTVQRSCTACATAKTPCPKCEEEQEKEQPAIHRQVHDSGDSTESWVPDGFLSNLGSGKALDAATRSFMEPRFGRDFSQVRVHTDERAAESAAAVGARAFTLGGQVVFAQHEYAPQSFTGNKLLAHELTHVMQQRSLAPATAEQTPAPAPSFHGLRATKVLARQKPACPVSYTKASSFKQLIDLVRAAEIKLSAAGITGAKDQIHALRGIYYGTTWSLDFSVEKSATRNEGFQRFTRPSQSPGVSVPPDVSATLDCGLFKALQDSQDMVDGTRHFDFGHMLIALDARYDPDFAKNVKYPVMGINIDLGGTGTELVTWLGDLGGGAAAVALARVSTPTTNVSTRFTGTDYGGSINLEGDIAGYVVASGTSTTLAAPSIASGKGLSDALQDYLTPGAAPSSAWTGRAKTFLIMQGATFNTSGDLTNRAALISKFAPKIQEFACNYLASRVKDKKVAEADAKSAANNVIPVSEEVAEAFVDALDDSQKTGNKIEAKKFPSPKATKPGACSTQLTAASLLKWLP